MTIRGGDAWSNFYYGSPIDTHNGCLINPEGSRLIFFERCKNHDRTTSKSLHILSFYTNHLGEPAGFKSTSKIRVEEAWEEWNDLQELGWTEVSHNFG